MKSLKKNEASSEQHESVWSNRRSLIQHRALIVGMLALPCLLLIFGLVGETALPTLAGSRITFLASFAFLLFLVLFNSYLLKDNPRLRRAAQWTFRSYRKSVIVLDEREKLVIDQAFRMSYRILALACFFLVFCLFITINFLHLAYRLGPVGSFYIMYGAAILLQFLPATIVAWHEGT